MPTKPVTIASFFERFPDEKACLEWLFNVRMRETRECPRCHRPSKWYKIKAERAYSCSWCGHHLHPTSGTSLQNSQTPLHMWFYAVYLFTTSPWGVRPKELQRELGVTYKTAWRMANIIREHVPERATAELLFGDLRWLM
jgi:transposase